MGHVGEEDLLCGEYQKRKRGKRIGSRTYRRSAQETSYILGAKIEGKIGVRTQFIQKYLPEREEMTTWSENVSYSLNKQGRWDLPGQLENILLSQAENIKEEEYSLLAVGLTDPHKLKPAHYENHFNFYFTNRTEESPKLMKAKSKLHGQLPRLTFEEEIGVKLVTHVSSTADWKRNRDGWINDPQRWCSCCCSAKENRQRKKSLANIDNSFYDNVSVVGASLYSESVLDELYWDDIRTDVLNSEDVYDNAIPEYWLPLITFERENKNKHNKFIIEDFLSKKSKHKKTVQHSMPDSKSFKGKVIYNPGMSISDDQLTDIDEPEIDILEEYRGYVNPTVIVFVERIDEHLGSEWEIALSTTLPVRRMLTNHHVGVRILLEVIEEHTDIVECNMRLIRLIDECSQSSVEGILDLFTDLRTLPEICSLATTLFASNNSGITKAIISTGEALEVMVKSLAFDKLTSAKKTDPNNVASYETNEECIICFDLIKSSTQFNCGHTVCSQCCTFYLTATIIPGNNSQLVCPAIDCEAHLDTPTVAWLTPEPLFHQYVNMFISQKIASDPGLLACPRQGCESVVQFATPSNRPHTVTCRCRHSFCSLCRQQAHYPAKCQDLVDYHSYTQKMLEYSRLENSVMVRPCPKCHTQWEKSYGCHHMKCARCYTDFCWGCGKVHMSGNYCGALTNPLETVSILPEPTENFSRQRIISFQLVGKLRSETSGLPKKSLTVTVNSLLARDRQWYFKFTQASLSNKHISADTERFLTVKKAVSESYRLLGQIRQELLMTVMACRTHRQRQQLVVVFVRLTELAELLTNDRAGRSGSRGGGGTGKRQDWKSIVLSITKKCDNIRGLIRSGNFYSTFHT